MAEQDRHNLRKLSPLDPRRTEVSPAPPPDDPADIATPDHPESDRAGKILSASLKFLGTVSTGIGAVPEPVRVVQTQPQRVDDGLHLPLSEMVQLQATADMFLQPARAEALSQTLGSE